MTTLAIHREPRETQAIVLPPPRTPISIRQAVVDDLAFIDQLQRKHARMVGWMPTVQLQANIASGNILIAEERGGSTLRVESAGRDAERRATTPIGYCLFKDRYFKRDDCGIVYQLNVAPGKQRGLIGATLIKAVFDRAAYGCKLFCCWCAQDLQANYFWESLGFVPLAFRTGSRVAGSKRTPRIHIFWQRRIRENDAETPYWFPSETTGGAVKENRLVLPIPPGTHWSDAKPAVLPGIGGLENVNSGGALPPGAADPTAKKARTKGAPKVVKPPARPAGGLWFAPAKGSPEAKQAAKAEKPKREKCKNDPKMVEAARELRDRYIDEVNSGRMLPGVGGGAGAGKYDVSRQIESAPMERTPMPLLKAA